MTDYFNPKERDILFRRIEALAPDVLSRDGKINGHQLLAHFNNSLRDVCGLQETVRSHNLLLHTIGKWLVFHVIPWPEKAPRNPQQIADFVGRTALASFEVDHQTFVSLLQTFESLAQSNSLVPHPAYGKLSKNEWGKYMFLHMDYHLTMFDIHGDFYARK